MPLLEYVKSLHPLVPLNNVLLIGCQHILATTHLMLRSLYDCGLDPKNIFLLGKCYSTNRSVLREMLQDGIHVSPLSFSFESHLAFDEQFSDIVAQFLEHMLSDLDLSKFDKIIILDDGGQLLALSMKFISGHKNITGIEQTSSGYEKIKATALKFPVINVARSQAKLIYESPMIANTVVKRALKRITELKNTPRQILILGNGAIGSAIYTALKNDYKVQIYDKNLNTTEFNRGDIDFEKQLRSADVIIGCSGETSIPSGKHKYLKKGCVLFSASSSDREFDAVSFRRKSRYVKNCHNDVEVGGITLLNCGFPINFDGGRHSVPPSRIQLTRALLMGSIFQACEMTESSSEIVPLDFEFQRDIIRKYLQLYPSFVPNLLQIARNQNSKFEQKVLAARSERVLPKRPY